MNREILYDITVRGKDFDDGRIELLQLYAKDKGQASEIAKKVIDVKYGSFSYELEIVPTELTESEVQEVSHAISETYLGLQVQFLDMDRNKFLRGLEDFQGFDFVEIDENSMSYWVNILGFTIKLVLNPVTNKVEIDETEIWYKSCHSERRYVIKNKCEDVYIGC